MTKISIVLALLLLCAASSLGQHPYQTIDYPGSVNTAVLSINDAGDVGGWYQTVRAGNPHGFYRHNGQFTAVDEPAGVLGTEVDAVNNNSQFAGMYLAGTTSHGFFWDSGVYTSIDPPGATSTQVYGMNDYGQVVGNYHDAKGGHGFIWDHWILTPFDLPGAAGTAISGISNQGQLVGMTVDSSSNIHGFLWDRGTVTTMDGPGGLDQLVDLHAINDRKQMVGEVNVGLPFPRPNPLPLQRGDLGFIMSQPQGFAIIQIPGSTDTITFAINNFGKTAGLYDDARGMHGFVY